MLPSSLIHKKHLYKASTHLIFGKKMMGDGGMGRVMELVIPKKKLTRGDGELEGKGGKGLFSPFVGSRQDQVGNRDKAAEGFSL